jgi:sugar phosphate isomerase/epimerase
MGIVMGKTELHDRVTIDAVGYASLRETSFGTVLGILRDEPAIWQAELVSARELDSLGHVEVWLEYLPEEHGVRCLQSLLGDLAVTVHGPFQDVNLASSWPELGELSYKRTRQAIEIAERLGASVFTIHAGKHPVYEEQGVSVGRFAERLERLAEITDVVVAVENVKAKRSGVSRETIAHSDDLVELIEVYPDARLTLDVAHAIQNGDQPIDLLSDFGARAASVHIHDVGRDGRSHKALGSDGFLDLDAVARMIVDATVDYVTLETLGTADTQRSWEALRESLARIRAERRES